MREEFLEQLVASLAIDNLSTFIAFYSEDNPLRGLFVITISDTLQTPYSVVDG